jgi:hypothetical protein
MTGALRLLGRHDDGGSPRAPRAWPLAWPAVRRDLPLRRSFHGHSSSASLLARADVLGRWLQLDVPGFRLVWARGGHGHTPVAVTGLAVGESGRMYR